MVRPIWRNGWTILILSKLFLFLSHILMKQLTCWLFLSFFLLSGCSYQSNDMTPSENPAVVQVETGFAEEITQSWNMDNPSDIKPFIQTTGELLTSDASLEELVKSTASFSLYDVQQWSYIPQDISSYEWYSDWLVLINNDLSTLVVKYKKEGIDPWGYSLEDIFETLWNGTEFKIENYKDHTADIRFVGTCDYFEECGPGSIGKAKINFLNKAITLQ